MYSREAIAAYIAKAAAARGIDPNIAVRVARSEGLNADPSEAWQSQVVKNGKRERSYGPFQLYIDGGLGNSFMRDTGLDPRDPSTWQAQVDYSLDHASRNGWGAWYGARNTGIGNMAGIGGRGLGQIPVAHEQGWTRNAGLGDNEPAGAGLDDRTPEFVQKGNAWLEKHLGIKPPTGDRGEAGDDLIALGLRLASRGYL